jgi:hypothetical protein
MFRRSAPVPRNLFLGSIVAVLVIIAIATIVGLLLWRAGLSAWLWY